LKTDTIIALIGSGSTFAAAIATWVQAHKMRKPINQINSAVNHRLPGDKKLVEMVENIHTDIEELKLDARKQNKQIDTIGKNLKQHQLYHQVEAENLLDLD